MQTAHGGLYVHHVCRTAGKPTKPAPYYSIDVRQMPSYSGPSFVVSLAHLPINHLYKPPISRLVIFFSPGVQSPFHLESRLHFLQFTTHPADVFLDLAVLSDAGGGSRQLYNAKGDDFHLKS